MVRAIPSACTSPSDTSPSNVSPSCRSSAGASASPSNASATAAGFTYIIGPAPGFQCRSENNRFIERIIGDVDVVLCQLLPGSDFELSDEFSVYILGGFDKTAVERGSKHFPREIASAQIAEIRHLFGTVAVFFGRYERDDEHLGTTVLVSGDDQPHIVQRNAGNCVFPFLIPAYIREHDGIRKDGYFDQFCYPVGGMHGIVPVGGQFGLFPCGRTCGQGTVLKMDKRQVVGIFFKIAHGIGNAEGCCLLHLRRRW